jgi:ParB family chromosome partitioning protein
MTNLSNNKNKKPQLGKGMAALLGNSTLQSNVESALGKKMGKPLTEETEIKKSEFKNGTYLLDISKIKVNQDQPRKIFDDKKIIELSNSIKENGIIQPLIVAQEEDGKFLLIAGERRYRASKLAGINKVPVVIKKVTKKDTLVMAIIENVQRSDLNCVEEGLAYFQLMSEYGLTQEEVAKKIGKERSTIANFLRILKLPREVLSMLQKEEISFGHAKVLASVKDDEKIKRIARETIEKNYSVRELEKALKARGPMGAKNKKTDKFFDEKLDSLRNKLEKVTGFHFDLKGKKSGSGTITIKYNNEAELNDIFDYLVQK